MAYSNGMLRSPNLAALAIFGGAIKLVKATMGEKMKRILFVTIFSVVVTACATSPDKIDAAYVSPLKYKDYDCDQIAMEMDYVGERTSTLYQRLKSDADADKWQMGVGLLVFWPTLFALEGGDSPEAAEYAQLKGEHEALRKNSVQKKCGIDKPSPEEIIEREAEA